MSCEVNFPMDDQSANASTEAMAGLTVDDKVQDETKEVTYVVADDEGNAAPAAST